MPQTRSGQQELASRAPPTSPQESMHASSYHRTIPEQPTQMFSCMWAACQESFPSLEQLVGHVNIRHLISSSTSPRVDNTIVAPVNTYNQLNLAKPLSCLWADCTDTLIQDRDVLASHLLHEHLIPPQEQPPPTELRCTGSDQPHTREMLAHLLVRDHMQSPTQDHVYTVGHDKCIGGHVHTPEMLTHHLMREHLNATPPHVDRQAHSSPKLHSVPKPYLEHNSTYAHDHPQPQASSSSRPSTPITVDEHPQQQQQHVCTGAHECRWTDCGLTFPTCDELTTHITSVHIGGGKAHYECLWDQCTRNGLQGFQSKQKICRHVQVSAR